MTLLNRVLWYGPVPSTLPVETSWRGLLYTIENPDAAR
jgi:hypothetical protein